MTVSESSDARSVTLLTYGYVSTRFGEMLTASDSQGLCFAGFVVGEERTQALEEMSERFPCARLTHDDSAAVNVFEDVARLHFAGSAFRRRVWRALLTLRRGECVSYSELARRAGVPRAVRAVASAVAANPLSVVVPCHRVVRSDGTVGEYHWGPDLKRRLLEWERN